MNEDNQGKQLIEDMLSIIGKLSHNKQKEQWTRLSRQRKKLKQAYKALVRKAKQVLPIIREANLQLIEKKGIGNDKVKFFMVEHILEAQIDRILKRQIHARPKKKKNQEKKLIKKITRQSPEDWQVPEGQYTERIRVILIQKQYLEKITKELIEAIKKWQKIRDSVVQSRKQERSEGEQVSKVQLNISQKIVKKNSEEVKDGSKAPQPSEHSDHSNNIINKLSSEIITEQRKEKKLYILRLLSVSEGILPQIINNNDNLKKQRVQLISFPKWKFLKIPLSQKDVQEGIYEINRRFSKDQKNKKQNKQICFLKTEQKDEVKNQRQITALEIQTEYVQNSTQRLIELLWKANNHHQIEGIDAVKFEGQIFNERQQKQPEQNIISEFMNKDRFSSNQDLRKYIQHKFQDFFSSLKNISIKQMRQFSQYLEYYRQRLLVQYLKELRDAKYTKVPLISDEDITIIQLKDETRERVRNICTSMESILFQFQLCKYSQVNNWNAYKKQQLNTQSKKQIKMEDHAQSLSHKKQQTNILQGQKYIIKAKVQYRQIIFFIDSLADIKKYVQKWQEVKKKIEINNQVPLSFIDHQKRLLQNLRKNCRMKQNLVKSIRHKYMGLLMRKKKEIQQMVKQGMFQQFPLKGTRPRLVKIPTSKRLIENEFNNIRIHESISRNPDLDNEINKKYENELMKYEDPNITKQFYYFKRQEIYKLYEKEKATLVKSLYIRTALQKMEECIRNRNKIQNKVILQNPRQRHRKYKKSNILKNSIMKKQQQSLQCQPNQSSIIKSNTIAYDHFILPHNFKYYNIDQEES